MKMNSLVTTVPSSVRSTTELCAFIGVREMRRVDSYLSALFGDKSRTYLQKLIEAGDVSINGLVIKKNAKIYLRDYIHISWRVEE